MITPKDDEQSILSAIDRFVACLGEDKATVANCIEQYIHLEADAVSRFNIVTLRARLPVDAVGIIQIPGSALVFYLHTVNAGRYFYAALHDLAIRCPSFEEARSLLQTQAAIRRASLSKTPGVDKHAQGIILHDVNTVLSSLRTQVSPPSPEQGRSEKAKRTVNDDDLDNTNTTLHQPVLQPAAASSEDSQSPQKVQQQSPIEADPLDWDPFEVDVPPQPERSAAHNLSSSSDESFVHQTPDQTSSAIEERFKHYESLDYNNLPAYIDVPSPNINSSGQYTVTSPLADPPTVLADSKEPSILSPAPIQPQTSTMASNSNHPQPESQVMPSAKRRRITLPNPLRSLLPGEEIQASLVSGILQSLCDLIPHRAVCLAPRGPATDATAVLSQTQSRMHGVFDQSPKEAVIIMPLRTNHHWALAFVRVTGQKQVVIETYNAASDQELTKEAEGLMCSLFDVPQDNDTALPKLCPRSSWNSISRHSVSQVDQPDSGVGVLIHSLYALAATSIPKEVDWLLWRRVLAAYKSARDSPLAAGGSSTHLTPPGDVLAQLRREHADSLGARSGVRVPVPADSIIRRALLDDANWLSVSSDEAPALDEALAELRSKLTSVPDKLKAKTHLARQTMYDIHTLVAVLLGQAAERPGPASNHLKNCQKDMDKINLEQKTPDLTIECSLVDAAASGSIRHLNCDVTSQADLRAVLDSIARIDRTGADAGVSGEFENFYNVFNVHNKLTKPGCGVIDANFRILPNLNKLASSSETQGKPAHRHISLATAHSATSSEAPQVISIRE
ncbi:putative short chain dehydrogenase/ reductase [Colletotrichum asianum]